MFLVVRGRLILIVCWFKSLLVVSRVWINYRSKIISSESIFLKRKLTWVMLQLLSTQYLWTFVYKLLHKTIFPIFVFWGRHASFKRKEKKEEKKNIKRRARIAASRGGGGHGPVVQHINWVIRSQEKKFWEAVPMPVPPIQATIFFY